MTATATAASAAFALRAGFVDHEGAAHEFLAIQRADNFFRFGVIANLREAEAARLARETIAQQGERIRLHSYLRKQRLQFLFSGLKREVAHVQFLHGHSPCTSRAGGTPARLKGAGPKPRQVKSIRTMPGGSERSTSSARIVLPVSRRSQLN